MDFLFELRKRLGLTTPEQDTDYYERQAAAGDAMLRQADVQPGFLERASMRFDAYTKEQDAQIKQQEADSAAVRAEQMESLKNDMNPYRSQGLRSGVSGAILPETEEQKQRRMTTSVGVRG